MRSEGEELSATEFNHISPFLLAKQLYVAATTLPAITLTPDVRDPQTHMAITVRDIKAPLAIQERPTIVAGVRAGLTKLNDVIIESLVEWQAEDRWGVEWRCTFLGEGGRYRRRGRIFFSGHFQYAIVLQGSSEERYAYWQGMFEWTMLTVGTATFSLAGWQRAAVEQHISHDLSVVKHISDRIAVMYVGSLVETASTKELFTRPLHPYTEALLSSVPKPDPRLERRRKIPQGEVADPAHPPSGCRFHPRCPYVQTRCAQEEPALREFPGGRTVTCHFAEQLTLSGALDGVA